MAVTAVGGLHHVTAISGPAQENLDFYAGILGMRLVKKSVNQDDTGTYHLFYADGEGHPGTDLTFFPWAHMAPPRIGHGLSVEVSLTVPDGTLEFWSERLAKYGVKQDPIEVRFGRRALPFADPHGQRVALVEAPDALTRLFAPWDDSPIVVERQIRGLESARLWEHSLELTASFLTHVMGFRHIGTEGDWHRYAVGDGGTGDYIDVREVPGQTRRGAWGVGSIHHLAWRVADEAHQAAVRAQVETSPSSILYCESLDQLREVLAVVVRECEPAKAAAVYVEINDLPAAAAFLRALEREPADRQAADPGDRPLLVPVGVLPRAWRRALRARDGRSRVRGGRGSEAPGRDARAAAVARTRACGD